MTDVAIPEDELVSPKNASLPDWSEATIELMLKLTTLQRVFVEWMSTGKNGAQAYRLASGRTNYLDHNARFNSKQLLKQPFVREAVASAMKDRDFGRRMDREYKLRHLYQDIEAAESIGTLKSMALKRLLIETAAKLQGEIITKTEEVGDGLSKRGDVFVLISQTIAEAKGLVSGREIEGSRVVEREVIVVADAAVGAAERAASNGVAKRSR